MTDQLDNAQKLTLINNCLEAAHRFAGLAENLSLIGGLVLQNVLNLPSRKLVLRDLEFFMSKIESSITSTKEIIDYLREDIGEEKETIQ